MQRWLWLVSVGMLFAPPTVAQAEAEAARWKRLRCKIVRMPAVAERTDFFVVEVRNIGRRPVEPLVFGLTGAEGAERVVPRVPWPWRGRWGRPIRQGARRRYFLPLAVPGERSRWRVRVLRAEERKDRVPRDKKAPLRITRAGEREARDETVGRSARLPVFQLANPGRHALDVLLLCRWRAPEKAETIQHVRVPAGGGFPFDGNEPGEAAWRLAQLGGRYVLGELESVEAVDWCAIVDGGEERADRHLAAAGAPFDGRHLLVPGAGASVEYRRLHGAARREESRVGRLRFGAGSWSLVGRAGNTLTSAKGLKEVIEWMRTDPRPEPGDEEPRLLCLDDEDRQVLRLPRPWVILGRSLPYLELAGGRVRGGLGEAPWNRSHYSVSIDRAEGLPGAPPTLITLWRHSPHEEPKPWERILLDWRPAATGVRLLRVEREQILLGVSPPTVLSWEFPDDAGPFLPLRAPTPKPMVVREQRGPLPDLPELRAAWEAAWRFPSSPVTLEARFAVEARETAQNWFGRERLKGTVRIEEHRGVRLGKAALRCDRPLATDAATAVQDLYRARHTILTRQLPAAWPGFERAFAGKEVKRVAPGRFACATGRFRIIEIADGRVSAVTLEDGTRLGYAWRRQGERLLPRRIVSEMREHSSTLEVEWVERGAWSLVSRWTITDWFHAGWGPESYELKEIRVLR